jgi:AcrR family transcriptional regulator
MARKTKEDSQRTYHRLLDAAARLFIRQGVASTTLGQIAAEAGMTRGAVYWHFDNKDVVIQALWDRNAERFHQALMDLPLKILPPRPGLQFRCALKQMLRTIATEPEVGQVIRIVMHTVEFTDEQTYLQRYLLNKKEEMLGAFESAFLALKQQQALRVDLPPELLAHSLLSYFHGLIHSHLSPPGQRRLDLRQDGDVLLDLLLDRLLID